MRPSESNNDITPVSGEKKEPQRIRIKRSSGRYEYVTKEELAALNKEKKQRELRMAALKDHAVFIGMFFLTVVIVGFFAFYTDGPPDRSAYNVTKPPTDPQADQETPSFGHPVHRVPAKTTAGILPQKLNQTSSPEMATSPVIQDAITTDPTKNSPTPTSKNIDDRKLIADTLDRWTDAWSKKRVGEYLLFYHDNFQPPNNMTKQGWIKDRWAKISRPAWITVTITAMEIDLLDKDHARAFFKQQYDSPKYSDTVLKTLHLIKTGSQWKITGEHSVTIAQPESH